MTDVPFSFTSLPPGLKKLDSEMEQYSAELDKRLSYLSPELERTDSGNKKRKDSKRVKTSAVKTIEKIFKDEEHEIRAVRFAAIQAAWDVSVSQLKPELSNLSLITAHAVLFIEEKAKEIQEAANQPLTGRFKLNLACEFICPLYKHILGDNVRALVEQFVESEHTIITGLRSSILHDKHQLFVKPAAREVSVEVEVVDEIITTSTPSTPSTPKKSFGFLRKKDHK